MQHGMMTGGSSNGTADQAHPCPRAAGTTDLKHEKARRMTATSSVKDVRERAREKEHLLAFMQFFPSLMVTELAAASGYDIIILDCEHGLFTDADILAAAALTATTGTFCFVRPRSHDPSQIGRLLDFGIDGLLIPNVRNPDEAGDLVKAMHYPPKGLRGFAASAHRVTRYGLDLAEHLGSGGDRAFLAILIETKHGVDRLDEILATDGIDAAMLGPQDLTGDLGSTGDFTMPSYLEACVRLEQACRRAGKMAGTVLPTGQARPSLLERGYRLFILGSDVSLMRNAMANNLAQFVRS